MLFIHFFLLIHSYKSQERKCICLYASNIDSTNQKFFFGVVNKNGIKKFLNNDRFNPYHVTQADQQEKLSSIIQHKKNIALPLHPFELYLKNSNKFKETLNESELNKLDSLFESEFNVEGLNHSGFFCKRGVYIKCRMYKIKFSKIHDDLESNIKICNSNALIILKRKAMPNRIYY